MHLLAIDGPAGAGKTTLAAKLEAGFTPTLSVQVIHLDDLYDGWANGLGQKLTDVLGLIVQSHKDQIDYQLPIFNWASMAFDSARSFSPVDVLIIEGVGACQKVVRDAGAATYWIDVDSHTGLERVLVRDGQQFKDQMISWQIYQNQHFASDQTRENCEFKLTS